MATTGRVEEKVVLVTGAAHGLGRADAEALAREGARVIVADRNGDGASKGDEERAGPFDALSN